MAAGDKGPFGSDDADDDLGSWFSDVDDEADANEPAYPPTRAMPSTPTTPPVPPPDAPRPSVPRYDIPELNMPVPPRPEPGPREPSSALPSDADGGFFWGLTPNSAPDPLLHGGREPQPPQPEEPQDAPRHGRGLVPPSVPLAPYLPPVYQEPTPPPAPAPEPPAPTIVPPAAAPVPPANPVLPPAAPAPPPRTVELPWLHTNSETPVPPSPFPWETPQGYEQPTPAAPENAAPAVPDPEPERSAPQPVTPQPATPEPSFDNPWAGLFGDDDDAASTPTAAAPTVPPTPPVVPSTFVPPTPPVVPSTFVPPTPPVEPGAFLPPTTPFEPAPYEPTAPFEPAPVEPRDGNSPPTLETGPWSLFGDLFTPDDADDSPRDARSDDGRTAFGGSAAGEPAPDLFAAFNAPTEASALPGESASAAAAWAGPPNELPQNDERPQTRPQSQTFDWTGARRRIEAEEAADAAAAGAAASDPFAAFGLGAAGETAARAAAGTGGSERRASERRGSGGGASGGHGGSGGHGASGGRSGLDDDGGPSPRAQRIMLIVAGALLLVLLLIAMFIVGRAATHPASDPTPTPTRSATPTPTPTPTPTIAVAKGPAAPGVHPWTALGGGECLNPFTTPWADSFTVVDCATAHAAQLVYTAPISTDPAAAFPGAAQLASQINVLCSRPGVIDLDAAGKYSDVQLQGAYPVTQAQWDAGQRSYFCFVNRSSGQPITGSLAGPGPK